VIATSNSQGVWAADRPLVLYGAGNAGRTVAQNLIAKGVRVAAFLDAGAADGDVRNGIPVFTLAEWMKSGQPEKFNALVSIYNPSVDVVPIIDQLQAAGFFRVLSIVDYVNFCADDKENRLWLVPSAYYVGKEERIVAALSLLADGLSREWLEGALRLRQYGDWHSLPPARLDDQYMPVDLPRWVEPMRLIDCGAYDGDTLEALLGGGYRIEAVAAFEPDPNNYAKLAARPRDFNAVYFPCGVSSSTKLVRFDARHGVGSQIDEKGELTIQCATIDEVLPSFAPNLIKMDIEGAEPDALLGAERTLRRHRPGLAISIYHRPNHLWEIPLWLAGLNLGYKMYMRGHRHCGYDLILYCRAD
jgi:FkbM family methyltransferase